MSEEHEPTGTGKKRRQGPSSHPSRESDLDAVQARGRRWVPAAWAGATVVIAGPAALTIYFFWRSSIDNGADCTFDNFDCAANRHFTDAIGWLAVAVMAAVAVTLTSVLSRRRRR
jgi:hypothetical protein